MIKTTKIGSFNDSIASKVDYSTTQSQLIVFNAVIRWKCWALQGRGLTACRDAIARYGLYLLRSFSVIKSGLMSISIAANIRNKWILRIHCREYVKSTKWIFNFGDFVHIFRDYWVDGAEVSENKIFDGYFQFWIAKSECNSLEIEIWPEKSHI